MREYASLYSHTAQLNYLADKYAWFVASIIIEPYIIPLHLLAVPFMVRVTSSWSQVPL